MRKVWCVLQQLTFLMNRATSERNYCPLFIRFVCVCVCELVGLIVIFTCSSSDLPQFHALLSPTSKVGHRPCRRHLMLLCISFTCIDCSKSPWFSSSLRAQYSSAIAAVSTRSICGNAATIIANKYLRIINLSHSFCSIERWTHFPSIQSEPVNGRKNKTNQ